MKKAFKRAMARNKKTPSSIVPTPKEIVVPFLRLDGTIHFGRFDSLELAKDVEETRQALHVAFPEAFEDERFKRRVAALLKKIEWADGPWVSCGNGAEAMRCIACRKDQPKHADSCELALLLRECETP